MDLASGFASPGLTPAGMRQSGTLLSTQPSKDVPGTARTPSPGPRSPGSKATAPTSQVCVSMCCEMLGGWGHVLVAELDCIVSAQV